MNQSPPTGTVQIQNQGTSGIEPMVRHGRTLVIWFLILGIVVGAVGMWALYQFIQIPKAKDLARQETLAAVREAQLQQEKTVSGEVVAIDKENQTIRISTGKTTKVVMVEEEITDDEPVPPAGQPFLNENIIEEEIIVIVHSATATFITLDPQDQELPSSFDDIKVGERITIINQEPIRGLNYINAEKIFVL